MGRNALPGLVLAALCPGPDAAWAAPTLIHLENQTLPASHPLRASSVAGNWEVADSRGRRSKFDHAAGITLQTGDRFVFRPLSSGRSIMLEQHYGLVTRSRAAREAALAETAALFTEGVGPRVTIPQHYGRLDTIPGLFQRFVPKRRDLGELRLIDTRGRVDEKRLAQYLRRFDWKSFHAVAGAQHVVGLLDRTVDNILFEPSHGGKLRFLAIDADLAFAEFAIDQRSAYRAIDEMIRHPRSRATPLLLEAAIRLGAPADFAPEQREQLQRVDVAGWQGRLLDSGVSPHDVEQATIRLQDVRQHGLPAIVDAARRVRR